MTKEDIVSKVRALNLPKGSYVVFGGALLGALGLREANDIDLYVSKEVHKNLETAGWQRVEKGQKDTPLVFDVFEAHDNWDFSFYNPTLEELLTRAIEIDGVMFASLADVKEWKKGYNRPKDISDIQLIDAYLQSESSA